MTKGPLIEADALAGLGPIRLLHASSGEDGPAGVTTLPIQVWIAQARQSASGLDDLAFWTDQVRRLGLGHDALTVVFDDGRMIEAARVWFILQYFGLPVAVLNGGRGALGDVPPQAPPATQAARLVPNSGPVGLKDRNRLKAELSDVTILDARTAAEFRGDDPMGNARAGHLPGASLLPHHDLLEGARLRPGPAIARMLSGAGIDGSKPVVSHCNGGGRAALAALAAVVAGHPDVHVYYLSFADWAADESCPVTAGG